jgi:hypothetical protein
VRVLKRADSLSLELSAKRPEKARRERDEKFAETKIFAGAFNYGFRSRVG